MVLVINNQQYHALESTVSNLHFERSRDTGKKLEVWLRNSELTPFEKNICVSVIYRYHKCSSTWRGRGSPNSGKHETAKSSAQIFHVTFFKNFRKRFKWSKYTYQGRIVPKIQPLARLSYLVNNQAKAQWRSGLNSAPLKTTLCLTLSTSFNFLNFFIFWSYLPNWGQLPTRGWKYTPMIPTSMYGL